MDSFLRKRLKPFVPRVLIDRRRERLRAREQRLQPRYQTDAGAATVTLRGDGLTCPESRRLFEALADTLLGESVAFDDVLAVEGMSGRKYRQMINRLIRTTPDARYLEIGTWAGSTACAAMARNAVRVTCIDNWSEFGGPRDAFLTNTGRFVTADIQFSFIEADFRQVDYGSIGRFNVYLFDGPHRKEDHRDGLRLPQPALDDTFLLVVDDWNWTDVRLGTYEAIRDLDLHVPFSVDIRTSPDNSQPARSGRESEWHNGVWMAVCQKPRLS